MSEPSTKRRKTTSSTSTPKYQSTESTVSAHDLSVPSSSRQSVEASTSSSQKTTNGVQARTKKKHFNPTHGNYTNYYQKRRDDPSSLDPRLSLCREKWFKGKSVLDIGCNSGKVTIEVAQRLKARHVVGVDIDGELIRRAERELEIAWSIQQPQVALIEAASTKSFAAPSTDTSSFSATPTSFSQRHFPISMPRMFGFLPVPTGHLSNMVTAQTTEDEPPRKKKKTKNGTENPSSSTPTNFVKRFPTNIEFRIADWVHDGANDEEIEQYDTILAFSITKWIHLNSLNSGLLTFFQKCHRSLKPGGRLILEPQPFSSYAHSARIDEKLKENLEKLRSEGGWKWEEGDFEKALLTHVGFTKIEKLGEVGREGFKRPIEVYRKAKR